MNQTSTLAFKLNHFTLFVATLFILLLNPIHSSAKTIGSLKIQQIDPMTMAVMPSVSGSYSFYVIRYCPEGSTWNRQLESVLYDWRTPSPVANPTCTEISHGYPQDLQAIYYFQTPDIVSLYGLDSLSYTMYFEVDVPAKGGSKRVLLNAINFDVKAAQ